MVHQPVGRRLEKPTALFSSGAKQQRGTPRWTVRALERGRRKNWRRPFRIGNKCASCLFPECHFLYLSQPCTQQLIYRSIRRYTWMRLCLRKAEFWRPQQNTSASSMHPGKDCVPQQILARSYTSALIDIFSTATHRHQCVRHSQRIWRPHAGIGGALSARTNREPTYLWLQSPTGPAASMQKSSPHPQADKMYEPPRV